MSGASLSEKRAVVPAADDPALALPAEHAQRGGPQDEQSPVVGGQPQPAGREDAQHVGMGEESYVARDLEGPSDDAVSAAAHLLHGLAARRAAIPHAPARTLPAHLSRRAALGLAIVPLEEIVGGLSHAAVAGEPARIRGAGERAGQDEREGATGEISAQGLRLTDACRG